jgi:hypothetical protein
MIRRLPLVAATAAAGLAIATGAGSAANAPLCVGSGPGCFATIQAALDAAGDGDTIHIGPGTFAGGVSVGKSVTLAGAGAGVSTIAGGGPVLTIGTYLAPSEPTVTIENLTVTGGVTSSSPISSDWVGADHVIALGGGIEISPGADYSTGATVTIKNSVVTGNLVAPTATLPIGPPCPGGPCSFAWAKGGGIDNWGTLTLSNSTVSDNTAAGVASDADGGGINTWFSGSLTLQNTRITGNRASARVPDGRYAEGGGIFTDEGIQLTINGGTVSGNTASLTSTQPFEVGGGDTLDMNSNGGGIHVGDGSTVIIENTSLGDNTVAVDDPNGEPYAFDAALHPGDGSLVLKASTISGNRLIATVGSSADVGPSGSAIDLNGPSTLENVRITGNTATVTSPAGTAWASAAGLYAGDTETQPADIANSLITGNTTTAASTNGTATVIGSGIVNEGVLDLANDRINANTATANAPNGQAQGAGIWNGSIFNPPPIQLTLQNTTVSGNSLTGSPQIDLQGSGIFNAADITLDHSRITANTPEPQCYGC